MKGSGSRIWVSKLKFLRGERTRTKKARLIIDRIRDPHFHPIRESGRG